MRNLRALKRAEDMPLVGRVMRQRKGVYVCIINFKASRRHYGDEMVYAPNIKAVKEHLVRVYPSLTFPKGLLV